MSKTCLYKFKNIELMMLYIKSKIYNILIKNNDMYCNEDFLQRICGKKCLVLALRKICDSSVKYLL